jgi:predicted outer membrane repeat protein
MRLSVGLLALIAFCLGTVAAADAATINHRSIGTFKGVLFGTGTASVAKGDTAVTFEGGTIPVNVGRGDEIVIDDEELYIMSRDESGTRLTLQNAAQIDHVGHAFAIRRAYTSIQAWVNDRNGNLVREDRLEVGVLYDDGPFTVKNHWVLACISGSRTDAEHFMWLTAAEEARHKGVAGTGVVLDGRDHTRTGILIEDYYTRIEGIELQRFGHWFVPAAVTVRGAKGVVLERLIIHDFDARHHENYGIKGGVNSGFTVRNCIIYDGGSAGIIARRKTASVQVENCTVYGMRGRGVDESLGSLTVVNTVSMGNTRGDFFVKRGTQSFNISSDGTAAGEKSKSFLLPIEQFVSVQKGLEDFHLSEKSAAIDAGKNLAPAATPIAAKTTAPEDHPIDDPRTVDIDGTDRAEETDWDIGADEVESAPSNVWYVDATAAPNGDGRSWKSAFPTIQQAIAEAAEGQEIWVRAGTYSLTSEIVVDKAIALLGGFAGNERKKEKRDPKTQPVVLSVASIGHAISLNAKNIQINGFVFRNANSANGGAVFAWPDSSFTIGDSLFEGNRANFGGGLYAKNVNGAVIGCLFKDNSAVNKGGGIYTEGSSLRIMNCVFQNNVAGFSSSSTLGGGGVYVYGAGAEILNCTFFGNRTGNINSRGAAVHMFLAQARMANCIIAGDGTSTALSVHSFLPQNVIVQSCNIDQDEYGLSNPNGNINAPPLWVDPARGDFHLQSGSPCRDAGSDNAPGTPATDFDGNPRVVGGVVDMGAFEYGNRQ